MDEQSVSLTAKALDVTAVHGLLYIQFTETPVWRFTINKKNVNSNSLFIIAYVP